MEDLDWMLLQVLYEKKSLTKAGKDLFISQPTVTSRIQRIEEEFGVRIVHRGNKGVQFTPQGEYLAKFAIKTVASVRDAKDHLKNMELKVGGTLRIGASRYFVKYKLPEILRLFRKQCPDVEFKVITTWSSDVLALINTQEVHVGFIRGDYNWEDQKHLLFEEPMVIGSLQPLALSDLPKLPRIDYRTDALIKAKIDNWWRRNYAIPPLISMEVDTVDTCKEMILSGLGYAIMPAMIVDGIPQIKKIQMTDENGIPLLRRTWMIYQSDLLELKMVKCFIDFVKSLNLNPPDEKTEDPEQR